MTLKLEKYCCLRLLIRFYFKFNNNCFTFKCMKHVVFQRRFNRCFLIEFEKLIKKI